jgi:hypothetical protein
MCGTLADDEGRTGDSERMSARRVRIVVGEGRSSRQGMLRFVLAGEGYDVVADASNPAELARVLAVHKPDVVVLDDGIGATTVTMVHDMLPGAKMILVWPEAVSPIAGASRVEPSQVLQDLGPTVERLTGVAGVAVAGKGPAAVDRAKGDPSSLRRMLRTAGVVDLVARSRGSHPTGEPAAASAAAEPIIDDREPAPVVILPVAASVDEDGLVQVPDADGGSADDDDDQRSGAALAAGTAAAAAAAASVATGGVAAASEPATGAAGAGTEGIAAGAAGASASTAAGGTAAGAAGVGAQSVLNRRLGNVALAGAAVAGALVFALALGGARVPVADVRGETITIPIPNEPSQPGGGNPSGTGTGPGGGPGQPGNETGEEPGGGGTFYPIQPFAAAAIPLNAIFPAKDGPPDLGVDPTIANPGTNGGPNDDHDPNHGNGNHGNKHHGGPKHAHGTATQKHADRTPGHSGEHNPHGGPPGLSGNGHGQGGEHSNAGGNGHGNANGHGNGNANGNGHGQGNGNGNGNGQSHEHGHGS